MTNGFGGAGAYSDGKYKNEQEILAKLFDITYDIWQNFIVLLGISFYKTARKRLEILKGTLQARLNFKGGRK